MMVALGFVLKTGCDTVGAKNISSRGSSSSFSTLVLHWRMGRNREERLKMGTCILCVGRKLEERRKQGGVEHNILGEAVPNILYFSLPLLWFEHNIKFVIIFMFTL
ncbi:hypothetical protein SETIT_8G201500v2 [Setaria italica]|uniref:Uncharacterized protein n=1 Tax=Setaria italica TaxID=4555 RepID=A0A368S9Q4_SETIT|nr:hypothetical protein SETIT_8G201500v2 [Setaria italica]